ncbi:MAG TPA: helix-turn-helix transcriptional regulator [Opitutaceae bacterium]|jgi:transcriptional regulator with XRE-family HTH domain
MAHTRKRKNIVGIQVRRIRGELALSQDEVAARCQRAGWDIDRFTIARIEAGSRWVGDFEVLELAAALRVPFALLFPSK